MMMMMRTLPWDGARQACGRLRLLCLAGLVSSHSGGHWGLRGERVLLDGPAPTLRPGSEQAGGE